MAGHLQRLHTLLTHRVISRYNSASTTGENCMNAGDSLNLLQQSLIEHGLSDWTGGLDNARRRFGMCNFSKKHISLSRPLCELNDETEVRDTVLHEIAHALAWKRHGKNCGHDKRWKAICVEIGARPQACYDDGVVQPTAPWVLVHRDTGEVFRTYLKFPSRDWSNVWIRGRKADTLGKLEVRSNQPGTSEQADQNKGAVSKPLKQFDQKSVYELRKDLLDQLQGLCDEYGLTISNTKGRYNERSYDLTLTLDIPSDTSIDSKRLEFDVMAPVFDLKPEDYLRPFTVNGKKFQLIGFKMNNRKYPVIAQDDRGQLYKFETSILARLD
jgi:hypothetical protein